MACAEALWRRHRSTLASPETASLQDHPRGLIAVTSGRRALTTLASRPATVADRRHPGRPPPRRPGPGLLGRLVGLFPLSPVHRDLHPACTGPTRGLPTAFSRPPDPTSPATTPLPVPERHGRALEAVSHHDPRRSTAGFRLAPALGSCSARTGQADVSAASRGPAPHRASSRRNGGHYPARDAPSAEWRPRRPFVTHSRTCFT